MDDDWLPYSLIGVGVLLVGILLVETLAIVFSPGGFQPLPAANLVTSVPFIAVLVGGGYWLRQSGLDTHRYRRITGWIIGSFLFIFLFFVLVAAFTPGDLLVRVGILRWGAAAGAGGGLLVGLLEARAIERATIAREAQVRNEHLQQQNERLEEFAGIIAHDLRNPLNVAMGYVDTARADHDDEHLDMASSAFDRMEGIIEETLTLARSGRVIEEPERIELSSVTDRCWENVATGEADLELEGPVQFDADPDRLQHLFENLFRNAIEHGGSDLTVRVGALPDGFYVEDDGPGIPEDERESVLDAGYSTNPNGTGFGLAITRQIVDAHGWSLDVTGGADGGARFEISGVDTITAGGAVGIGVPGAVEVTV